MREQAREILVRMSLADTIYEQSDALIGIDDARADMLYEQYFDAEEETARQIVCMMAGAFTEKTARQMLTFNRGKLKDILNRYAG